MNGKSIKQIKSKMEKRLNNVINNSEYKRLKEILIKFKPLEEGPNLKKSRNLYASTKSLLSISNKNINNKKLTQDGKYQRTRKRSKTFMTKDLQLKTEEDKLNDIHFTDEYSAIRIGDKVELIKNYISPPKKLDFNGISKSHNKKDFDGYYATTTVTTNKAGLTDREIYNQYLQSQVSSYDKENQRLSSALKYNKTIKLSSLLPNMAFLKSKKIHNVVSKEHINFGGTVINKNNAGVNKLMSGLTLSKFYLEDKPVKVNKLMSGLTLSKFYVEEKPVKPNILPKIHSSNVLIKIFNN
jgi:hypothetical protein